MKRIILLLATAIAAITAARADETSESILRHLADRLAEYGNYEVRFTVSSEGMGTVKGSYIVSGDRYRIKIQRNEQFSDGVNRYEIYPTDKEVVIDVADTDSHDLLSNPTRAFEFAPEEFDSTYKGPASFKRRSVETVLLSPREGEYGTGTITLYLDAGDGWPVALEYGFEGDGFTVTIERITRLEEPDPSLFMFDPAAYADYEVIDFR